MPTRVFTLPCPPGFALPLAVCSYGYFLLEPNRWQPTTRTFDRALHGQDNRVIRVAIAQDAPRVLRVRCDSPITTAERAALATQITRMLRLDQPAEIVRRFQRMYPEAKKARFGWMFRSPTLFEDIVKTMTGCNVTWTSTMRMNRLLCEHVGNGAFPTPAQLARLRPSWVKQRCKVGYRAERIVRLARDVDASKLDLTWFDNADHATDEVFDRLTDIYGIGEYAAGNICHLLGRYDRLAIDTETYRHFEEEHGASRGDNPKELHPRIERHYSRFAPYQFLAYWFDLWNAYQRKFGRAWGWDADKHGPNFTAAALKKLDAGKQ